MAAIFGKEARLSGGLSGMTSFNSAYMDSYKEGMRFRPLGVEYGNYKRNEPKDSNGEDTRDHDNQLKPGRSFLRLSENFYRRQALSLVYEESEKHVSLSTTRVRQRLCDLMGTDVIRLNDKRYFQKLSQRLEEEYDGNMDKQEDARAATENERLRRLMLEGIIDAPNDYRAVVHGESKHKVKKTKKRTIKRRIRIVDNPPDHDSEMRPRSEDEDFSTHTSREDVRTQVEFIAAAQGAKDAPDGQQERPPPKSIIKKTSGNKENDKMAQQMHVRPPHHDQAIRSSSSCSMHRKSRRVKSAAPRLSRDRDHQSDDSTEELDEQKYDTVSLPDYNRKTSKYFKQEPETIRRLRKEQTVAGLYSIAEELVSPLPTEESERKVIPKKAPKKVMKIVFR